MKQAFLAAVALAASLAAGAAPFVPRSGAEVLETLPRRAEAVGAALRSGAAQQDAAAAAMLAQRYIEHGRAAGDPRYFGYAQAALAPWWKAAAPPTPVLLMRATLLQASHRFDAAVRDLDAVTRAEPGNAQAWLTLATVQVVRGDFEAAVRSCARLSSLASRLAGMTCLANARASNGQLAASERMLALSVERSGMGGLQGAQPDAGLDLWALTLLGELAARRGNAVDAEQRFRKALALAPGDSYLLGAYADLLLDQRRNVEVQSLLRGHLRNDGLLLRHTLAAHASARDARTPQPPAVAAAVDELRARFDASARRGDSAHQREQARFALHLLQDARRALQLALANWRVQKEGADLRILLEAAVAADDPAAVRGALDWRRRHGFEDGTVAALARTLEGAGR